MTSVPLPIGTEWFSGEQSTAEDGQKADGNSATKKVGGPGITMILDSGTP